MRRLGSAGAVLAATLLAGCSDPAVVPPAAPLDSPSGLPSRPVLPSYTPPPPTSFTVVAGGDVLIHSALTEQATADGGGTRDYRRMLDGVRQVVAGAELAICHLDVPLGTAAGPFTGFPTFNAPPEVAGALASTGFDECSTASNNSLDHGVAGVRSTLDALDAAGIGHTGSARSPQEAATPLIMEVAGAKVGHVAFTYGFNVRPPAGSPWVANALTGDDQGAGAVLAAARAAKQAGADVVIVSLHWGEEYRPEPTQRQRDLAAALLADDAVDLVVGHHAHVVQPFEQINGKWVAYGLGNLLARHAEPRGTTEEGAVGRFRFAKAADGRWRVDHVDFVPTLIDLGPPIRVLDLARAAPDPRHAEAMHRIEQAVQSHGAQVRRG
jgi:poly-gamma-glutamate capsule biosynthesis protein CapA/YwtB (metallophosphatase superfamily)